MNKYSIALVCLLCLLSIGGGYALALLTLPDGSGSGSGLQLDASSEGLDSASSLYMPQLSDQIGSPIGERDILSNPDDQALSNGIKDPQNQKDSQQDSWLNRLSDSFVNEMAGLVVDNIPMNDLIPLVSRVSGINQDVIWDMEDPHDFAKNLINLGIADCSDSLSPPSNTISAVSGGQDSILFSNELISQQENIFQLADSSAGIYGSELIENQLVDGASTNGGTEIRTSIRASFSNQFSLANSTRIYANFQLPSDYQQRDVIVRWCKRSPDDKSIVFGPHQISLRQNFNYVWYQSNEPETGEYFVQIFTAEQTPSLIAESSYSIVAN